MVKLSQRRNHLHPKKVSPKQPQHHPLPLIPSIKHTPQCGDHPMINLSVPLLIPRPSLVTLCAAVRPLWWYRIPLQLGTTRGHKTVPMCQWACILTVLWPQPLSTRLSSMSPPCSSYRSQQPISQTMQGFRKYFMKKKWMKDLNYESASIGLFASFVSNSQFTERRIHRIS